MSKINEFQFCYEKHWMNDFEANAQRSTLNVQRPMKKNLGAYGVRYSRDCGIISAFSVAETEN